ncbi:hypothetical protein A5725_25015 [Mycobacterium kubicae]|uniref:Uncharacterized protein n=2 Tax=Mycobacterium TaxID=1763 RepID=A0A1X0XJ11_MYCSI|nr:hypothetical protein A5725_25015 [Mycobacterium kubicae]ORJ52853.1 hypothetical protein B5M45_30040 [Mycobacterium simiae]
MLEGQHDTYSVYIAARWHIRSGPMNLIEVDTRRRITLPKSAAHDLYMAATSPDGTITLVPAVVRSALEDALRQRPGYVEQLQSDAAADPGRAVRFDDWEHPGA